MALQINTDIGDPQEAILLYVSQIFNYKAIEYHLFNNKRYLACTHECEEQNVYHTCLSVHNFQLFYVTKLLRK